MLRSVHTPNYMDDTRDPKGLNGKPMAGCAINPDLSRVAGIPMRHWKIYRGKVLPMTARERGLVDDARPEENEGIE